MAGDIGVTPRAKRHDVELLFNLGNDLGVPIADLVGAVAMKIEGFTAKQIDDMEFAALRKHVQARGRQALVQEVIGVLFQPPPGFIVEVPSLPLPAMRGKVAVPFNQACFACWYRFLGS
jgi:hypothetical protein